MAEYIERKLLKKRFLKRLDWLKKDIHDEYSGALYDCCITDIDLIDEIPYADVAPVVHGRWIPIADGEWAECSECGESYYASTDGFRLFQKAYGYCPNCGAKMGGGVNE